MNVEEKFIQKIDANQKKDLHFKFFEQNGELQYIIVPLFTSYSGEIKI